MSCIYGLGSAEAYEGMLLALQVGDEVLFTVLDEGRPGPYAPWVRVLRRVG